MGLFHWIFFLGVFWVCFAATPAQKPVAKKAPGIKTASAKTAGTRTAGKTGARVPARKGKGAARPVASTWRSRQAVPTPERYKDIQGALVAKGYLKSEPN